MKNALVPHIAAGHQVSSPRVRGWSRAHVVGGVGVEVFPARAGVVRSSGTAATPVSGLPRACGGGPCHGRERDTHVPSSPRVRGWSATPRMRAASDAVFPARAGVVRGESALVVTLASLPRACGGGPSATLFQSFLSESSPRVRGWSAHEVERAPGDHVFPARAGVVPSPIPGSSTVATSSPRVRGWSPAGERAGGLQGVFPARAGVVLYHDTERDHGAGLPRACGGGPQVLHDWSDDQAVFPASAGVVRCGRRCSGTCPRLPRACGGPPAPPRWCALRSLPRVYGVALANHGRTSR